MRAKIHEHRPDTGTMEWGKLLRNLDTLPPHFNEDWRKARRFTRLFNVAVAVSALAAWAYLFYRLGVEAGK